MWFGHPGDSAKRCPIKPHGKWTFATGLASGQGKEMKIRGMVMKRTAMKRPLMKWPLRVERDGSEDARILLWNG